MAYSRWGDSFWYTFRHVLDVEETRDNALFSICSVIDFTAKELRGDLEGCIKKVESFYDDLIYTKRVERGPGDSDMRELRSLVAQFLEEVDKDYQYGSV